MFLTRLDNCCSNNATDNTNDDEQCACMIICMYVTITDETSTYSI